MLPEDEQLRVTDAPERLQLARGRDPEHADAADAAECASWAVLHASAIGRAAPRAALAQAHVQLAMGISLQHMRPRMHTSQVFRTNQSLCLTRAAQHKSCALGSTSSNCAWCAAAAGAGDRGVLRCQTAVLRFHTLRV